MTEIANLIRMPLYEANDTDYRGEDGLLRCGICHEPKEAYFPAGVTFGELDHHPTPCLCQRSAREKEDEERQNRKHHDKVNRLAQRAFDTPEMRLWTFENATIRTHQMDIGRRYVEHWDMVERENCGLLLWGGVGTGKSYTAACIANALIDKEVSVCMTNLASVINYGFEGRNEYICELCSYRLLILDDFGMERDTPFALESVFDVIDARYRRRKPLIVSTNLSLDSIKNPVDPAHKRIYDRVLEMTAPVKFLGESLRVNARNHNLGILRAFLDSEDKNCDK